MQHFGFPDFIPYIYIPTRKQTWILRIKKYDRSCVSVKPSAEELWCHRGGPKVLQLENICPARSRHVLRSWDWVTFCSAERRWTKILTIKHCVKSSMHHIRSALHRAASSRTHLMSNNNGPHSSSQDQTHEGPVVLCLGRSLFPPHPLPLWPALTLHFNNNNSSQVIRTRTGLMSTLCWFDSLQFMRHKFKPATQHKRHTVRTSGLKWRNDPESKSDIIDQ